MGKYFPRKHAQNALTHKTLTVNGLSPDKTGMASGKAYF